MPVPFVVFSVDVNSGVDPAIVDDDVDNLEVVDVVVGTSVPS
jgi:hypothetical protein